MTDTLKQDVAKKAYETLLGKQPGMIKAIGVLLDQGQSVEQVTSFAGKHGSPLIVSMIEQAALHMKKTGAR